jgi:hypothetical protein
MPIRNTSLEYAARVPRYSERTTMHAPTRGLFNKTLPLRTQRPSRNTRVRTEERPQGVSI